MSAGLQTYSTLLLSAPRQSKLEFYQHADWASTAVRPLDQLEKTIAERKSSAQPDRSYTAKLLVDGVPKIGAKVTEEAAEVVEAAAEPGEEGRQHTVREAGDVLYHLLVLLAARDITLAEVEAEIARRFSTSGLEEKASRRKSR
jgi:phosphoribosyl-ATP pyrophosphohydrolase